MRTDVVLSPFGADANALVTAARIADDGGFDGVWTFDHFSGVVAGAPWSRDPFVTLGAIAAVTERVTLGVLVANIANRHAVQLASAVNTLQGLAPDRVLAGIGAGAGPGTRFAAEHEAIGRQLGAADLRRDQLLDYLAAFRAVWAEDVQAGPDERNGPADIVDRSQTRPRIIVGASGPGTIGLAAAHSDGVNIRAGADLADKVVAARDGARVSDFEISVFDRLDLSHPIGGDPAVHERLGIARRTLVIDPPYDLERLTKISRQLQRNR